jgi:PAS domain S-box-containing protein
MAKEKESIPQDISFAKLAETSPAALTKLNKEGRFVYANKQAEEVLGLEESEITERTYEDPAWKITDFEGDDLPQDQLPFRRVKETEEPVSDVRHAIEWPNGKRKYLSVNASPLFEEEGNFDGVVAVLDDITEREQLEYDLKTSEKRYRRLFETAQDGMLILNADTGKIIDANPYIRDLLGLSKEELVSKELWQIGTFRDVAENKEKFERLVEEGYVRYEHLPLETKNGEEVPVEFVSNSYMVDGERVVQCNVRDITDRKEAREKLKSSEDKFRVMAEQAHDGLFIHRDDKILWVNDRLSEIIGYSNQELYLENPMDFFHPEDRNRMREIAERRIAGKDVPSTYEARLVRKDGEVRDCEFAVTRIEYNGKQAFLGAVRDITERKKAHDKLKRSEQNLRQSFIELAETTSRVLGVRDPYTQKHELRVGELAREVGERMGLGEDKLLGLYIGGVLHDIGKIAIPETILTKPGELKDVEWRMIKSHPKVGYNQILEDTDFPWPVAEMTLHHHERLDGSGYPDGLEGDELTKEVRILGAVDVVEAMSTRRPYREARSKERTLNVIKDGKGDKFDPEVVDILVEMIEEGEIEFGE